MTKAELSELLLAAMLAETRAMKLREDWSTDAAYETQQAYFAALRATLSMEPTQ